MEAMKKPFEPVPKSTVIWKHKGITGIEEIANTYRIRAAVLSYRVNDLGMTIGKAIKLGNGKGEFQFEIAGYKGTLAHICEMTLCQVSPTSVARILRSGQSLRYALARKPSSQHLSNSEVVTKRSRSDINPDIYGGRASMNCRPIKKPDRIGNLWPLALGMQL